MGGYDVEVEFMFRISSCILLTWTAGKGPEMKVLLGCHLFSLIRILWEHGRNIGNNRNPPNWLCMSNVFRSR